MFALFALLSVAIGDGRRKGQVEVETGEKKRFVLVSEVHFIRLVKITE